MLKDIFIAKMPPFSFIIDIVKCYISSGIKLMLSNIVNLLIIGFVRFAIENKWGIETFAKISITMNISNILMVFAASISVVLFPLLRKVSTNNQEAIYCSLRRVLMTLIMGLLVFYLPLKSIFCILLPKYAESFKYMAVLIPVCIFDIKESLLIRTFFKTIRKENYILIYNFLTLVLSALLTFLTVYICDNLTYSLLTIVSVIAFKSTLAEYLLGKYIKLDFYFDIILEIILIVIFIFTNWFYSSNEYLYIYPIAYLLFVFIKRKDIVKSIKFIKQKMRS